MLACALCLVLLMMVTNMHAYNVTHVKVFHYILDHWGISYEGDQSCPHHKHRNLRCEWTYNDKIKNLNYNLVDTVHSTSSYVNGTVTVALYNIHSW